MWTFKVTICQYKQYLRCYWPDFDENFWNQFFGPKFFWINIFGGQTFFGSQHFLGSKIHFGHKNLLGLKKFFDLNFQTKFFWPLFSDPIFLQTRKDKISLLQIFQIQEHGKKTWKKLASVITLSWWCISKMCKKHLIAKLSSSWVPVQSNLKSGYHHPHHHPHPGK